MKHFDSILASLLMFVGLVFAGNASAQTPDWEGTAISAGMATSAKPVYLYNVGAKAFLVNGEMWGTQAALNTEYGLPIISVTGSGTSFQMTTGITALSTNLGMITESGSDALYEVFCDRGSSSSTINMTCQKVSGNAYNITFNGRYMTANPISGSSKKGTLTTKSSADGEYSQWLIITYDEIKRHLEKSPADLNNPTNVTYLIKDPNLDRGSNDKTSWKSDLRASGQGLKVGYQTVYNTTFRNGDTYTNNTGGNSAKKAYGKYWGAEARGVRGQIYQDVKVYHTGWYSVSCQGFYWNAGNENKVVSLFATVDGDTRNQFLALGNTEGSVPSSWSAAAQALFPANRYTNAVMFFVSMNNPNENGYDANGKTVRIGLNWDEDTYASNDWTVFDDFQLEFMGYNTNLVLVEDNLDHDYLTETEEGYTNSTMLLNRKFSENKWNTLVLPVSLTKKQFLTAFGGGARIANLEKVQNGVISFETIMKTDKTDDFVLLEANKPYIVYIEKNPGVTVPYEVSLTPIAGGDMVKKAIGGEDVPYYMVPFVTLDKDNLAGVTPYTYGSGDMTMTFTGTLVKTYDDEQNILVDYSMLGNIIFKGGKLWQLDSEYGMKAYRAWLEPGIGYFDGEDTSAGAKISFEIDGIEDDATYIHGIFNEGESTAEKFANGIYTINGMNMSATSVENLPKGIYIVNGKKYIVK